MRFDVDEYFHVVLPGETCFKAVLVRPNAIGQVRRHPNVQGAVALAGKNVDTGLLWHKPVNEPHGFPLTRE